MTSHSSKHPHCFGKHSCRGGENYAEQITDEFSTCHQCHRAAYRSRHRIITGCGHIFCDPCLSIINGKNENIHASMKCPLCHMMQEVPTKRIVNVSSEAMVDRLLRRHNRAHGRSDVFHDIRIYQVDPITGKAAF